MPTPEDLRWTTWTKLLPTDVTYTVQGGNEYIRKAITSLHRDGQHNVLVSFGDDLPDTKGLDSFSAIVIFNAPAAISMKLAAAGYAHIRRFALVPSIADTRWLVPMEDRRVASAALKQFQPFRRVAKAKHFAARLAALTGTSIWYRDYVTIAQRSSPFLVMAVEAVLDKEIGALAISTGTPGPTRKPVFTVLGKNGAAEAVVKVADSPITRRLLCREAHALRALNEAFGQTADIPSVLLEAEVDGRYVTAQSVLPGRAAPTEFSRAHKRFLAKLESPASKPARASAIIRSLPERIEALRERGIPLLPFRDVIDRLLEDAMVPETIVHGDFAPWNLRHHNGDVGAFDWEYSVLDGLPLLDELHYRMQTGFLLRNWTDDDSLAMMRKQVEGGHPTLDRDHIRGLQITYLLHTLLQRREVGYPPEDQVLNRCERLLRKTLRQTAIGKKCGS